MFKTKTQAVAPPLATVLSLEKPSSAALDAFLTKRSAATFNHPFAGCTSLINGMVRGGKREEN